MAATYHATHHRLLGGQMMQEHLFPLNLKAYILDWHWHFCHSFFAWPVHSCVFVIDPHSWITRNTEQNSAAAMMINSQSPLVEASAHQRPSKDLHLLLAKESQAQSVKN